MATWLLVDFNYLCYRARYSTGGLSHNGLATGVAFGVLRDLEGLRELHAANRVVIACDSRKSLRKEILPTYKSSRRENQTDEEKEQDALFYAEIDRLSSDYLPRCGYRNVITVEGYEGDDIIAAVALTIPDCDEAVIVSSDTDLFQCLRRNVRCFNPSTKKSAAVTITSESFIQKFGLQPEQWPSVKALAGCQTDDVEGLDGIGVVTAAGWFTGKLKQGKKFDLITKNLDTIQRNLPLVKLPYPGLVLPELRDDELTEAKKLQVQSELGIRPRRAAGHRPVEKSSVEGFF